MEMETVSLVLGLIRGGGDFMFLIDLKDAYLQMPIHPNFQPYLWIALGGKVLQFREPCFGLSTAPEVFTTKVFAVVLKRLAREGFDFCVIWMTAWWQPTRRVCSNSDILWRCNCTAHGLPVFIPARTFCRIPVTLCLLSRHSLSIYGSSLMVVSQLIALTVPSPGRPVRKEFCGQKRKLI